MERREKDGKRKKMRRLVFVLCVVFAIFLGLFGTFLYDFFYGNDITFTRQKKLPIAESKVNILIIGYDSEVNGKPRSDTLMLASFDTRDKSVGVVSIPRDTRVQIKGRTSYSKINAAFAEGGGEMSAEVVSELLGVPIDYYISTNFDGFKGMIDAMGGIEVNVEENMKYDDNAGNLHIDLKKGRQVLDGEKAIQYVRFREYTHADLGRIERQQNLIREAVNQILTPELVLQMPKLVVKFKDSIHTNMSFKDMMNLAKLVKNIKPENIKSARIPGVPEYIRNVSYFLHDPVKTEQLVNELVASKSYVANSRYHVAVLNGNGIAGIATKVATDLKLYGYDVDKTANADHYNYTNTLVVYSGETETPEIENLAKLVGGQAKPLSDLNLPVHISKDYDALVILGKNFSGTS